MFLLPDNCRKRFVQVSCERQRPSETIVRKAEFSYEQPAWEAQFYEVFWLRYEAVATLLSRVTCYSASRMLAIGQI